MLQGIILEGTSDLSNEELQRINPRIVCVMHVPRAMESLEDHITVTLNGAEYIIYEGSI